MDDVTLTVRLIRSFEYRNIRNIVVKGIPLNMLVKDFMAEINNRLQSDAALPVPFKRHKYDAMKVHSFAYGSKTSDTAINLDHEEWILDPSKTLQECLVRNETEISYFNLADYRQYKQNPQLLW
eukprot:Em0004g1004a